MYRILFLRLFIFIALTAFAPCTKAVAQSNERPVLIMTHMKSTTHAVGCWLNLIYNEAFGRLGYLMQYTHVPAAQASAMADFSETDGELGRSANYGENHPNLIRVEEPHLIVNFCVYSKIKPEHGLNWKTLLGKSEGIIGYSRGIEKISSKLDGLPKNRVHVVNTAKSGLRMLAEGRLDYFIGPDSSVNPILVREEMTDTILNVGLLESDGAHAYLNIRHKKLAIALADVLRKMKAEGLLERYAKRCGMQQ